MSKSIGFRGWYYFRQGWSMYFAFIFAAINTLTVTYYLAIEKYPTLQTIFPNFPQYVMITAIIGIPLLVAIGYIHFKRTKAFRSETAIMTETNPYARRNIVNGEINLKINLTMIELFLKLLNNEKISQDEYKKISKLEKELSDFVNNRTFENNDDLIFFNRMVKS